MGDQSTERQIGVYLWETCSACNGNGRTPIHGCEGFFAVCDKCFGQGKYMIGSCRIKTDLTANEVQQVITHAFVDQATRKTEVKN